MRLLLVCVRDSAVGAFNRPFCARSEGEARRSFSDEVNRPESAMHAHPEHYELFSVGEFDEEQGVIVSHAPRSLVTAEQCVISKGA